MNIVQRFIARIFLAGMEYTRKVRMEKIRRMKNVSIHSKIRIGELSEVTVKGECERLFIDEDFGCRRFCGIMLYPGATLIIHKNVFFNNNCSVTCLHYIEIGENTIFGEAVKIYDHNHDYKVDAGLEIHRGQFKKGKVLIGKNCWIASNVTILMGVTIGDNVIIGANCLIYKAVPSNTIVRHKQDLLVENIDQRSNS